MPVYRRESLWPVYLALMGFAATAIGAQLLVLRAGTQVSVKYGPLVDAALGIKLAATAAHLRFEETLGGKRPGGMDEVWRHLDSADLHARAMLEGGRHPRRTLIPLDDPRLRQRIMKVRDRLAAFREATVERWGATRGREHSPALEQRYHTLFEDFMQLTGEVETQIHKTLLGEVRTFRTVQVSLIVSSVILAVAVAFALRKYINERSQAEEERRRLEAQIQHAQKMESLGVLAGGIAHDFNNLLVGILGHAGLAQMDLAPESSARPAIERIETAAQRAADLAKQMLAYSGKGSLLVEPLDLSKLVEETAHLLEVSISKKAVLRCHLAQDLPAVEADATQIRQVVMNLITNASDALIDRSGTIAVRTGAMEADRAYLVETYLDDDLPGGYYVYLEVSDTGEGMGRATLARIFDPFFTTKFTGRGLGLAAVLGIVRGHAGALKVSSTPGVGTTFRVLLPCKRDAPRRPERSIGGVSVSEPDWRGTGSVLVADDEDVVRTVARMTLERFGFTVLTATHGEEAVDVFRAHAGEIVAVLLDVTMPRLSGEEVFREMRRIRADVPVLLSSGYDEVDAARRFMGDGLAGFIQKPYRPMELVEKLRAVVQR